MNGYEPPDIDPRPGPHCRFVKSLAELDGLAASTPPAEGKQKKPKRKTGSRFGCLNAFVDFTMATLSRAEIATWLTLFRETQSDGIATASVDWLAKQIGMNRRTVLRTIKRLEKNGLLTVTRRGSLRRGPSRYHVLPLTKEAIRRAKTA